MSATAITSNPGLDQTQLPGQGAGVAPPPPAAVTTVTTNPPADTPSQDGPQAQGQGETRWPQEARDTIAKLREFEKQSKAQARELETLRAKAKEEEDAKLSEQDRLKKKVADLEEAQRAYRAERRELLTRTAVERGARALNIVDDDAAYRLLDPGALEFDESGAPTNVEKALGALLKARPYLAGPEPGTTGTPAGTPASGTRALPSTPRPAAPAAPGNPVADYFSRTYGTRPTATPT